MATNGGLIVSVSGIRGIVGESLTPGHALAFASALGAYHKGGNVVVEVSDDAPWVRLAPGDALPKVLADLSELEPCGESNPAPSLALMGEVVMAREVTGGHLKLELRLDSGERLGAFGVGMGGRAQGLSGTVAVSGKLRPDRYRGGCAIELKLDKIW